LVAVVCLANCSASDTRPVSAIAAIESPARPGSAEPNLAIDARGRVHMTWHERTSDSTHALRYAILDGARWSAPQTIAERGDFFVNCADFPSVFVTASGRVVVHWLQRSGSGRYAYDVRIAQSSDDGATWSESVIPHRDDVAAEHGFVSFFPGGGDSVE